MEYLFDETINASASDDHTLSCTSSLVAGWKTVEQFANAVRSYGGVESIHWVLDVTFGEDSCRVRKEEAARNFSVVRKIAFSALRMDTLHPAHSLRRRRKLADRRSEYREALLKLKPRNRSRAQTMMAV